MSDLGFLLFIAVLVIIALGTDDSGGGGRRARVPAA
jgi:hypothetical protein